MDLILDGSRTENKLLHLERESADNTDDNKILLE